MFLCDDARCKGDEEDDGVSPTDKSYGLTASPPRQYCRADLSEGTPYGVGVGDAPLTISLEARLQLHVFGKPSDGLFALVMTAASKSQCCGEVIGAAGCYRPADTLVETALAEDVEVYGERMAGFGIACTVVETVEASVKIVVLSSAHRENVFQTHYLLICL